MAEQGEWVADRGAVGNRGEQATAQGQVLGLRPPERVRLGGAEDLDLTQVRRLLDELATRRLGGELHAWDEQYYDALCGLERRLLGLGATG